MDFKFTTEDAYCYYCNNGILPPQKCKFFLELKTWGGKNTLISKSWICSPNIESNFTKVTHSYMHGGSILRVSTAEFMFNILYFLLPWISSTITAVVQWDKMNQPGIPLLTHLGFYSTITIIYSYIHFSLFIAILNVQTSGMDVIIFILIIFCFCFYPFTHIAGIPFFLNGERIGTTHDFKVNDIATGSHIVFWCIYFILAIFILAPYLFYDVLFSPTIYFIFSNAYVINIIVNIIAKRSIWDHPASMVINSFYIGYLPFSSYGPTLWIEGYNMQWTLLFILAQGIQISIVSLQFYKGSRFFLPSSMRTMVYDKYRKRLMITENCLEDSETCNSWTNNLSEPELEYSDSDPTYKYERFDPDIYFELPCSHKFHPNCLLRRLKEKLAWPIWDVAVPKNRYDD